VRFSTAAIRRGGLGFHDERFDPPGPPSILIDAPALNWVCFAKIGVLFSFAETYPFFQRLDISTKSRFHSAKLQFLRALYSVAIFRPRDPSSLRLQKWCCGFQRKRYLPATSLSALAAGYAHARSSSKRLSGWPLTILVMVAER
jgi:hypothetical protein